MDTRVPRKRHNRQQQALCLCLLLAVMAAGCSISTYTVDGFTSARTGSYTRNVERLAQVDSIAIAAFYGQNLADPDGSVMAPVMEAIYAQARSVIDGQSNVTFLSFGDIGTDPAYLENKLDELPVNYLSINPDLTSLPTDAPFSEICESLKVDALLFIGIELDWDFPTWNAANVNYQETAFLIDGVSGEAVWEAPYAAPVEILVPLPSDFARLVGVTPHAEGWQVVMEGTAEVPQIKALGGAPVYFLLEDIRVAGGEG